MTHALPVPLPMVAKLSVAAHAVAVFSLGIMAGFFATYATNVSPAMLSFDGPTYAMVQSAFNRHVRHTLFFVFFFGPMHWCGLAVLGAWREHRQNWWRLTAVIGVAYALGIVMFTREVNLPLNALTESWIASQIPQDWGSTREAWNSANNFRAWLNAALFALCLSSLMQRLGGLQLSRRSPSQATASPSSSPQELPDPRDPTTLR